VSSRLFQHGIVDSTNERALAAVASGAVQHGDVHVAEGQSAGRGRLGRSWSSPAGEGLYLSLVLLPARPANPAALTMAAGLGVLEGVRALGAAAAELKWPNDVLAPEAGARAKLAGILVETRGLDPARPHAVVGVGLNLLQRAFPAELVRERAVTSLLRLGLAVPREQALAALLAALGPRLEQACADPAAVAGDYARAGGLLGRTVSVQEARGERIGRLLDLTLDGLLLELVSGGRARIPLEHALVVEALA
jgi:BirA family biotin operon repressor/biotin-[acetyl-CoA-carboxylase] ligase